jgi:Phosphotransferase enzyme family
VRGAIDRARRWMRGAGVVDPTIADRVERAAARFADYFAAIPPRPFLDDTTTKNVLVSDGRLSGIVDVDCVCYGDRLFPIALTRASLRNAGHEADYTDDWLDLLAPTAQQRAAVAVYTALFCSMFLGEIGQTFNREREPVEPERIARLCGILEDELRRSEG